MQFYNNVEVMRKRCYNSLSPNQEHQGNNTISVHFHHQIAIQLRFVYENESAMHTLHRQAPARDSN